MKIVEQTQARLVIEDRPWFLWIILPCLGIPAIVSALTGNVDGWAGTIIVASIGIGALWVAWHFAPFQRFIFDRDTATFVHKVARLNGSQTWEKPLKDIRRAADEGHWSDGARLERVTLLTQDGRYPLESGYTGFSRKAVIDSINNWLETS